MVNNSQDVQVDIEKIKEVKGKSTRPYLWNLIGYCDGRLKERRAKVKRKHQQAYNKGYDDGRSIK
jgi:hypothetical protein